MDIRKYLLDSSILYYKHLDDNNLGIDEIKILAHHLSSNQIHLLIDKAIIATEYLNLFINDKEVDISESSIFNKRTKTLIIRLSDENISNIKSSCNVEKDIKDLHIHICREIQNKNIYENIESYEFFRKYNIAKKHEFINAMIEHGKTSLDIESLLKKFFTLTNFIQTIKLYSDLKFLVSNMRDFCLNTLEEVKIPTTKPLALTVEIPSYVNEQQRLAIKEIFSNPISYVWGISGSGKTQVVLYLSALNIILQDKKLLILAPTNTALEQILSALIKECDKRVPKIDRKIFLRLGMASFDFVSEFPEVCTHSDDDEGRLFSYNDLKQRMQEAKVIAATLDTFIMKIATLSSLEFSHIFLDECAFSPLIKLIPPLSFNVPITLLGDHKQLMPICLMDENKIRNHAKEVCVWNLNTLFIEELLKNPQYLHLKRNQDDIEFEKLAHFKLNVTHRYGNNLAKILDSHIYFNGLIGKGEEIDIYYVDTADKYGYESGNENHGEAVAISNIVRNLSKNKDYAILTPFRNQCALLISHKLPYSRVLTIHKSQGKEFDLVILSPVKFSQYMTDSNNRIALFTLNVAVSRAKRHIIIVCDYALWIRKDGQFINSLLKIAKPYNTTMKGFL